MKKRAFSFLMAMLLFIGSPITVHASSDIQLAGKIASEILNDLVLDGAKIGNLIRYYCETFGLWLSYDKWGDGLLFEHFDKYIQEKALIETSETYEDYLRAHLSVGEDEKGEPTLIADSDMMNTLYDFSKDLIESNSDWYIGYTVKPSSLYGCFDHKEQYDSFVEICNGLKSDEILLFCGSKSIDGTSYPTYMIVKTDGFVFYKEQWEDYFVCYPYYNWQRSENACVEACYFLEDGTIKNVPDKYLYYDNGSPQSYILGNTYSFLFGQRFSGWSNKSYIFYVRPDYERYRIYKTFDDYKAYSIGQRPYYITTEYNNYDSTVDNSTTINQTTIDNSIAYGDVYNYITNNYENPDGLTEDQLRDILDDYLDELKNNQNNDDSGGGGSGGSDDSGGSGLGGLLSGLGGLGDAILAILGKLIEYVGKALELLSGTVTKVIDIIPSNITALLSGLFPFIPEEWLTIIELSLVLGVILGIVGMFKK